MATIEIKNIKGTFDYLPKEQKLRNSVTDILTNVFESFGYLPAVTPTLCYYDVLASKYAGGAEILKEVYKLTDQGERDLALRYDLTVPFAKLISLTKDLKMPFKRYEIGKVFRDGPVKVGRNREFIQCDVDVVGIKDVFIDAELISLYVAAFQKLEIPITVFYNNRKLMTGILEECHVSSDQMNQTITVIDKFKKLTPAEIEKEFLAVGLQKKQIDDLYSYFNLGFDGIVKRFEQTENQNVIAGIRELNEIKTYLDNLEIQDAQIDLTLARGLDIYTGTIFEVFTKDSWFTSAVGGGGRYDKIITNFIDDGEEYPAVGCSFGLDAICEILKHINADTNLSNIDVFVIPLNTKKESLKIANFLRAHNIRVDLNYNDRKLNKILNSVDREKIPFVIILGEDEVKTNKIALKNMFTKETKEYEMQQLQLMVDEIQQFLAKKD